MRPCHADAMDESSKHQAEPANPAEAKILSGGDYADIQPGNPEAERETVTSPLLTLEQALEEWRVLLGSEAVLVGKRVEPYRVNCLSLDRSIPAVVRPTSETQVIKIVESASRHKIPLYAISGGHNWGYGTALPVTHECVIVDLSSMNRILSMDPELGLLSIEPGVTQKQLYDFLAAHGYPFFVPTTGAGPTASLVGNALERGFGMTPEEDHFTAVTSVRAILPDGRIYQPAMSEIGAPLADGVYKWGIGPYLDGLFTQGNFGIVTALQISLIRRPEHSEVYVFMMRDGLKFADLVVGCRETLTALRGSLGGIKLINRHQLEMTTGTPQIGFGFRSKFSWMGFGVIHGPKSTVRPMRREISRSLKPYVGRLIFLNDERLRWLKRVARFAPGPLRAILQGPIERVQELMRIIHGEPAGLELRLAYRHVPMPNTRPLDPIRDGVRLLWYAPVIPMKRELVAQMAAMVQETLEKYGFDAAMSLTTLTEKCAMGVIPVIYRQPEERDKAMACFRELWKRGIQIGCYPYRLNIAMMQELTGNPQSVYWSMVQQLKSAIDPKGILSPGRYTLF